MDKEETHKQNEAAKKLFVTQLNEMLDLIAQGRGIEILLRIRDQTEEELKKLETYEKMQASKTEAVKNQVTKQTLPRLFSNPEDLGRIKLAQDIGDKLAHGLIRTARKLIDQYQKTYGLETKLNNDELAGWVAELKGHVTEEDGRQIETIVDTLRSTNKNTILEEFEVFKHNNYDKAAKEIFADAWRRINKEKGSIGLRARHVYMLRGWKRGKVTYREEEDL